MIIEKKSYMVKCDCGQTIEVSDLNKIPITWKIEKNYSVSLKKEKIKKVICPDCLQKEMLKKYQSTDIRERIEAGYYKDNPALFYDDALNYIGISLDHPKARKLYSIAYDYGHSSGYSEVLNYMIELSDLIK
jgi:hypothetical protein